MHVLVAQPPLRLGLRHVGVGHMRFGTAMVLMIGYVAVSVVAAHILYVVIERPAVRWSHRLGKLRSAGR